MKRFKQIIGYSLLLVFIVAMVDRFYKSISDVPGREFIVLLVLLIVLILIMGISRILQH